MNKKKTKRCKTCSKSFKKLQCTKKRKCKSCPIAERLKSKQRIGKKKITDLNSTEKNILKFVSILDGETMPVGSFLFREHYYPGDIDMCETIVECCHADEAKRKIVKRILTTINRIMLHKPKVFFADFKAGVDNRFNFKLLMNMNSSSIDKLKQSMNKCKTIITNSDYIELLKIITNEKDNDKSIIKFNNIIHEYRTIRWDFNELLIENKTKNGKVYKLEDAIACGEVVKLDVWYKIDDRYIEVTNFMNICISNKNEERCEKYLSKPMGNLISSLMEDIHKYFIENNYLKCIKRIWSLLNHVEKVNKNLSNKLKPEKEKIIPMFRSHPAKLAQIQADLEVIRDMVKKFKKKSRVLLFPSNDMLYYLLGVQNKLKCILKSKSSNSKNIIDLHDFIDKLFTRIDKMKHTPNTITLDDEKYWDYKKNLKFITILDLDLVKIMNFISINYKYTSKKWLKTENIDLEKLIIDLEEKLNIYNLII